jgi:ribonuclease HIII
VGALKKRLTELDFTLGELAYGHFRAQKGKVSVQAYLSGKLVVNGKEARQFIEFTLEPEILGEARLGYDEVHHPEMFSPHLGIDESGKGDFFGPLVIAGVYTDRETAHTLLQLGVKDSKQISSDQKALDLAESIRKVVGPRASVINIGPEKYNLLYDKFKNLNKLLAWGHAKVIENLLAVVPDCPMALSDQFANPRVLQSSLMERGKKIELRQRTKAEADVAVAAASILARAGFLDRLQQLGESVHHKLPKGASAQVKRVGEQIFQQQGLITLQKVAKAHFRTFLEVQGIEPPPRPDPGFFRKSHR